MNPDQPEETMHLLEKAPLEKVCEIHKTLNPSNRRRDSGDFNKVSTNNFKECWIAPDGVTIIPVVYDLARSNSLIEGFPGKPVIWCGRIFETNGEIQRRAKRVFN